VKLSFDDFLYRVRCLDGDGSLANSAVADTLEAMLLIGPDGKKRARRTLSLRKSRKSSRGRAGRSRAANIRLACNSTGIKNDIRS
jgi:hypothetical protein